MIEMIDEGIGEIALQWLKFQMNRGHFNEIDLMKFEQLIKIIRGNILKKHRWNAERWISRNDDLKGLILRCGQRSLFSIFIEQR